MSKNGIPKLRHHKASGQAFVELNGRRFYLGKHDSPEAEQAYHQRIAEWIASGREAPVTQDQLTVVELVSRYMRHAETYYRKPDGRPTSEIRSLTFAVSPLLELYSRLACSEFSPKKLVAVQERMISRGWTRNSINRHIGRIKRIFKWGCGQELVSGEVYHALTAVSGLKWGRSAAREADPVQPVPIEHVDAVLERVSTPVAAMIRLQLLTAARPGEICNLKRGDINTNGEIWTAVLKDHKTAHHGRKRVLTFGPKAQSILMPFLLRADDAYVFSPAEAVDEVRQRRNRERKTPLSCGNRPGTNRKKTPNKTPGDHYHTGSYRRCISRACQQAGVPHWHPHQLRHSAATLVREKFGLEAAQAVCGHSRADITEIYAQANTALAAEIAARMG